MSEVKVEEKKEETTIQPMNCPVCGVQTNYTYLIHESDTGDKGKWMRCQCGIIFQDKFPEHKVYDEKYFKNYADMKEGETRLIHTAHTYANVIEETTYGRMMLDVGFCTPNVMEYFKSRGWLTWGIDVNPSTPAGGSIYRGNFLEYDFSPNISKEKLLELTGTETLERKFDLIWMSHVLEHFNYPLAALQKSYDLLSETGVLFIDVPDADFINKTGVNGYPHWKMQEHYTLWTEGALKKQLEKIGFKVILGRRNFSSRFPSWFSTHVLAQKDYF